MSEHTHLSRTTWQVGISEGEAQTEPGDHHTPIFLTHQNYRFSSIDYYLQAPFQELPCSHQEIGFRDE